MNSSKLFVLLGLIFMVSQIGAQEIWSLEKCIQHAQSKNLNILQSQLAVEQAKLLQQLNAYSRYPSLNANSSFGYQFGRTIDPTTNSFITEGIGGQNLNVDAFVTLYSGGKINNSIRQSKLDVEASTEDVMQASNDIALLIASSYLSVLLAKEQMQASKKRLALTETQISQSEKLIKAGAIPANDLLDVLAQKARNEQDLVIQENALQNGYLDLKQLLQLEPDLDLDVEVPSIEMNDNQDVDALKMLTIYEQAALTQPFIKAGNLRLKSAELQVDIAKADRLPTLSLFGGIDSRYSTNSPSFSENQRELVPAFDAVINGQEINVETYQPVRLGDASYTSQIKDNLGESIGLSLRIPIYNNHRTHIGIEQAKLNIANTKLQNEQAKQQLKSDIQRAISDLRASKRQLEAAEKTLKATQASYENASKKFELGAINSFELSTTKNSQDLSEVEFIVAKYQYIFQEKVVDFYRGKQLSLN